ncbi:adrenodoxin, mitochondrial-like isoform X1 [Oncorhynchus keta]|uniref:adrenodoxin, mitochondrial-like isoform X1 n=1 Tax=Oncorhynchus keta TaxID=8018 RepID=UPI00227B9849|nr:adrenodoxin, mitochondrial-like isoform X1 [Oncorhynchus keta]
MSVASASIQFFTRLLRYRTKCGVAFHAASRILISPYLPQVFGGNKVLLGTCAQPLSFVISNCLIAATPIRTRERRRSRAVCPPKHNPTKPHCFLTQCPFNPESSCTNVSEETPYTWRPCQRALRWSEEKVTVYFINRDGRKITTSSAKGDSLLDLVVEQNLDIEGFGACEGTLACSTCHVILDQKVYNQLGPITDEENDMLDLAFGLTDTSRLGCQVCLSRDLEGITVRVPDRVNDMRRSDDAGPTTL